MGTNKLNIAVIGGGIIGTSTALCLIESIPDINITIISDQWSPNTTGDGSAGLIVPYLPGKTSPQAIRKWFSVTLEFLGELYHSPNGGKLGIGLFPMYVLFESERTPEKPEFADDLISFDTLNAKQLQLFDRKWKSGHVFTTYFAECTKLLPYLLHRYHSRGGKTVQKRINSLKEIAGQYHIIINCTGLESYNLVSDKTVHPIRGQVIRVNAPWIKYGIMAGDHYIIPNSDTIILGGTKQVNNWNTDVDDNDREYIYEGCCRLCPSLRSAEVVRHWVGLRPGREQVRIEREMFRTNGDSSDGRKTYIIHNYGHGGSGVTLFWGCAQDVCDLVEEVVNECNTNANVSNSKL